MDGTLTFEGRTTEATRPPSRAPRLAGEFFWLDLDGVDDEAHDLLLEVFHIHPLAVEDAQHFGQRPKMEDYDDFTYMVVHGASADAVVDRARSISSSPTTSWSPSTTGPCRGHGQGAASGSPTADRPTCEPPQLALIYLIIDQLVDSFFPMLDKFDSQIDELEDAILVKPTDAQLGTLFAMKRSLIVIRKVITPQRDMFASITSGVVELPGVSDRRPSVHAGHLRPPDPDERSGGRLPRPPERGHGHPPVDRVQPAQRGHEAADHHRHRVPAPQLPHRLLRPELLLA